MRIVVLDTETTGKSPEEGAKLLEVAWVALNKNPERGWEYGAYDFSMVEHAGEIPPEARAVHHIAPHQVAPNANNCLPRDAVLHSLLAAEEPGAMAYAAHNAAFDRQFLGELGVADEASGMRAIPWICTYRCAMHIWPEAPGFSAQCLRYWRNAEPPVEMLQETVEGVSIPLAPHRALYDTACTAAVLLQMLESHSAAELVALTRAPILQQVVRFGKHKGLKWGEVPRDYLAWLYRKSDMCENDPDLAHTVRHHLGLPTA